MSPIRTALLCSPCLLLASSNAFEHDLSLAIEPDTGLTVFMSLVQDSELVDGQMTMMDQSQPMPDDFSLELLETFNVTAVESYPSGAEDADAVVVRGFDEIVHVIAVAAEEAGEAFEVGLRYDSDLMEERVRFEFDDDGERICVLAPGGWIETGLEEFEFEDAEQTQAILFALNSARYCLAEPGGELTFTLESVEEGIANVTFEGDVDGDADLADRLTAGLELAVDEMETEGSDLPSVEAFDLNVELAVTGTFAWDLEAGHLSSLTWSADLDAEVVAELSEEGAPGAIELTLEYEGDLELTLTVE